MAGQSRTLKLSILGDIDQLKRSLDTGSREVQSFGSKLSDFGKKAGLAFAAAGAAAGVYATKLAVDGVKAAIADAAAQEKLATTLRNVTGATDAQIKSTENYITQTSLAFGVTDDDLRPSLERLARATGDVEKAQKLQTLAIDIAAGSGKSLEAVSNALAKAQEGNTAALGKLGVGLSAATLKTLSMDEITKKLADTFENQATVKAETLEGKMARLSIAFEEGKESIGAALLPTLTKLVDYIAEKAVPKFEGFVAGLTGDEGAKLALDETAQGGVDFGEKVKKVVDTVIKFQTEVKVLAGILATVFVIGKIAGFAASMITSIKLIVTAMNALRTSSVLAGIAGYFALNPLLGIGIGAATLAGIAGFSALSSKQDVEIEEKALGGPVKMGQKYLVGEKGPELFVPGANGSIVPNNKLGNSIGSGINITVNGALDPESVARQIITLLNNSNYRGTLGAGAFA
jgi:hypothetical protein